MFKRFAPITTLLAGLAFGFALGVIARDIAQEHHDKNRISVEIDKSVGPVMSPALPPGCRLSARGTYFCISTGDK